MIESNPRFIDEKIELANTHYQPKLDPSRSFLDDIFVAKLKEISAMFGGIIFNARNLQILAPVLFNTIKSDPYVNEYMDILTKFDQFLAEGLKLENMSKREEPTIINNKE